MQINRLFEMVYLLLNKESITAGELAQHFEVSSRTIYRDVELLSSAGIPIYMTKGKGGGISLLSDFVLNKAVLTDGEKSDILSALHAVEAVSLEQANSAVQKLSSLFGNTNADWVEVDFSGWARSMRRTVEPMKLCFKGQSWYLYAYCTVRMDYRFFKLRRMKALEPLSEHFERPIPAKIFGGENVFQDDFVTITLKLSREMAYRIYDEFSQFEELSDGSFLAKLTMPKGDWVYQYLATFGEHCEILEPKDIRLQVKEKLQKTLAQYF